MGAACSTNLCVPIRNSLHRVIHLLLAVTRAGRQTLLTSIVYRPERLLLWSSTLHCVTTLIITYEKACVFVVRTLEEG